MSPYPLSAELAAFVQRTLSYTSADSSLKALRDSYARMCRDFTPPPAPALTPRLVSRHRGASIHRVPCLPRKSPVCKTRA